MKLFNNFKIGAKILCGFFMVAIIAIIIGITGIINLNTISNKDTEMYEKMTVPMSNLYNMNHVFQNTRSNLRDMIMSSNAKEMLEFERQINDNNASFTKDSNEFKTTTISVAGKELIKNTDDSVLAYEKVAADIISLAKQNKDAQAIVLMNSEGVKTNDLLAQNMKKMSEAKIALAKAASNSNAATASSSIKLMLIFIIIGATLAIGLGIIISKSITKPIKKLVDYADRIALGDVDIEITESSKDETGTLMDAFKKMVENIRENAAAAESISKGDFNVVINPKSDKDVLAKSLILVVSSVKNLEKETNMLIKSCVEGKLATRGDADNFNGAYKNIVEGINNILDAVIEPIKEASSVLQEMANGNLKVSMKGDYKGDHADIKNALNDTINSLSSYVTEISEVLGEMSNSNLKLSINNEYKGDFAQIKDALNLIVQSFNEVFTEINNAADQVSAGSNQVSDGSQALSQGTTEQASSIEELTASITQVAAQTKQNAVSASQANELALNAKDGAVLGNSHMKEMLKSMEDINESSSNISKIIKVIDDIAFQTNMLALNAAVEAARAGQHGKGFAVVAEEVRNLAARSTNAAKQTADLIEGSIKKVEFGTKIANNTAESLNEIVIGVSKAATLVGEIAAASNEQATAIYQINKGIEQVSDVVQTNSATAEQSAAASEELSSQASMLKNMVGKFRLKRSDLTSYSEVALKSHKNINSPKNKSIAHSEAAATKDKPRISLSNNDFGKY
ncbi:methyl-accepting chemotaxis protein [Clostridium estertheticum]|uniref:HAMP domain-containing methyl-accepting chemotaxis protein n=1 Tax=Clostridium estertheticum TaxID=238834 RepID=UPI001C0C4516|nr:methyl-accepting chemotaxis protein [Clostridium estertheticum]MBU3215146.1 MCP four helix bundle domain-containing protein [Clostridium estertheticum]WAG55565.1 methyl-accepting chemotaxis protein [Clostridium estertheticum]